MKRQDFIEQNGHSDKALANDQNTQHTPMMHHGHLLKFEGKSWRLKEAAARQNAKMTEHK